MSLLLGRQNEPYLDGCGSAGEGDQSTGSLVLDGWTGGLQQVVDAADESGSLRRVCMANLWDGTKTDRAQTLKGVGGLLCFSAEMGDRLTL